MSRFPHPEQLDATDPPVIAEDDDVREMTEEEERAMHRSVVEEYVRLGFSDGAILDLFRNPFYRATNAVYRARGQRYVQSLIASVRATWRPGA